MSGSVEIYRGFVNTWQCDENDHLNVQFYLAMLDQGLAHLRARLGLTPARIRADDLTLRSARDHIRYLSERHAGDCVHIDSGVLDAGPDGLRLYSEMKDAVAGTPVAGITSVLEGYRPAARQPTAIPADVLDAARALTTQRPDHGGPRGVPEAGVAAVDLTLDDAHRLGLVATYHGSVQPAHCDAHGWNAIQHVMSRLSDGAGNMFARLGGSRSRSVADGRGGVALEQALRYLAPLYPGTPITLLSAPTEIGDKTSEYTHLMFDAATGGLAATARVRAASFDLKTRRISPPTDEERARLEAARVDLTTVAAPA